MYAASPDLDARARNIHAVILHALARTGLGPAAKAIGKDDSTVSRMKDRDLPALSALLSACGLKVVPTSMRCFDEKRIEALMVLANAYLERVRHAGELAEDEAR